MDAALIAALLAYTAAVLLAGRYHWSHRCAECAYRHRAAHAGGRHRATGIAPAVAPPRALAALPPGTDPDPTTPALPARPHPSPYPRHG